MLNYIASDSISKLIEDVCKEKNILILYERVGMTDILKYVKETKVNFNLIKYFIIDISCINNNENEIIENLYNFNRLHEKIRIIVIAQGIKDNSSLLNNLYDKSIYNIANSNNDEELRKELLKCLSGSGMQKKDAIKFKKTEELKPKSVKKEKAKKSKKIKVNKKKRRSLVKKQVKQIDWLYFFGFFLEIFTRLIKLFGYIALFILTSIGITILLNEELRNMVFQILSLK